MAIFLFEPQENSTALSDILFVSRGVRGLDFFFVSDSGGVLSGEDLVKEFNEGHPVRPDVACAIPKKAGDSSSKDDSICIAIAEEQGGNDLTRLLFKPEDPTQPPQKFSVIVTSDVPLPGSLFLLCLGVMAASIGSRGLRAQFRAQSRGRGVGTHK